MKALIAKHDGYASETPETAVLTDMTPFVELADIERPKPKAGQVLIKVKLAAVNPSDEMFIQGLYGQPRKLGRPVGFEGVGEVVETGSGLMAGRLKGKRVGFFAAHYGTWSEYALTDAQGTYRLFYPPGAAVSMSVASSHFLYENCLPDTSFVSPAAGDAVIWNTA